MILYIVYILFISNHVVCVNHRTNTHPRSKRRTQRSSSIRTSCRSRSRLRDWFHLASTHTQAKVSTINHPQIHSIKSSLQIAKSTTVCRWHCDRGVDSFILVFVHERERERICSQSVCVPKILSILSCYIKLDYPFFVLLIHTNPRS